jgi:hypothetical protein
MSGPSDAKTWNFKVEANFVIRHMGVIPETKVGHTSVVFDKQRLNTP